MNKGPDAYRTIGEASVRLELSRMLLGSGKLNFLNLGQLKDLVGEDFTDHLMLIN